MLSVWFHLFIVSLELLNSKERPQGLLKMQTVFLSIMIYYTNKTGMSFLFFPRSRGTLDLLFVISWTFAFQ